MARITPFEQYATQYERWFEKNAFAYRSEILAVKKLLPSSGKGIEIGVGSGRFSSPFCIEYGIEPSERMSHYAQKRGVTVIRGIAETLPIRDEVFEYGLMVTTICFLDDIEKSFQEVFRILRKGGLFIVGFIDKNSLIGKNYQEHQNESLFYREAEFYSAEEIVDYLSFVGFDQIRCFQTIFRPLKELNKVELVKKGYGEGSFVVIRGEKNMQLARTDS